MLSGVKISIDLNLLETCEKSAYLFKINNNSSWYNKWWLKLILKLLGG